MRKISEFRNWKSLGAGTRETVQKGASLKRMSKRKKKEVGWCEVRLRKLKVVMEQDNPAPIRHPV